MFGLGWPEVIVIAIAFFFIFGAKKIPEMGSALGKSLRGFKEELKRPSLDDGEGDRDEEIE
ncbi:MAG: twin-arginine translocase TatA/TatE family subunit [Cyanobacteriota bacterium]|nr:twin-arginine translocase TatA/TatE family subunit [Cyanobacteriota bacterium]